MATEARARPAAKASLTSGCCICERHRPLLRGIVRLSLCNIPANRPVPAADFGLDIPHRLIDDNLGWQDIDHVGVRGSVLQLVRPLFLEEHQAFG